MSGAFTFQEFPRLQTERFLLRAMEERDCSDIMDLYSDEEVVRYTPLEPFHRFRMSYGNGIGTRVYSLNRAECAGLLRIHHLPKLSGHAVFFNMKDASPSRAWLRSGASILGAWSHDGVAQRVLAFGFRDIGVNRVEAKIDPENIASERLLLRLGFQKEGVMRQQEFEKGRYVDIAMYSLLRNEYEAHCQASTADA